MKERIKSLWRAMDRVDVGLTVATVMSLLATAFLPLGRFSAAASVIVGAFITLLVTKFYYRRAGEELRAESKRLLRYNEALMSYLHAAGVIQPGPLDEAGDPIPTVVAEMKAASLEARGEATEVTVEEDDAPEDRAPDED